MKKKLIVRLLLLCILGLNFQFGNAQDLGIALKILDLQNVSFNDGFLYLLQEQIRLYQQG